MAGVPYPQQTVVSWQLSDAERRERFEKAWAAGDLVHILTPTLGRPGRRCRRQPADHRADPREDPRVVKDPRRPTALSRTTIRSAPSVRAWIPITTRPTTAPTSRWSNLREEPIKAITATGITTDKRSFDVDVIVFATGFDAMTGAIMAVHPITGRAGKSLSERLGAGTADLSRPHRGRLPEPLHDHGARQPVGAVEHGGVDRAACRLGGRPPRMRCATPASPRSRRPRRRRPAGARHMADCCDADAASARQHLVHGRQRCPARCRA